MCAQGIAAATEFIQVSGKNLGELSHVGYCPRCASIKLHVQHRLPYRIFPGIFSSIDAYTKRVVEHFLDLGAKPDWLVGLGEITGYREPPSYRVFQVNDEETGIRLTGAADAIFVKPDGSFLIADYKTSKYTRTQDALHPTYEAQLNAYAWIGERTGFSPVTGLALVYMHPLTSDEDAQDVANHREHGFAMTFRPHVKWVDIQPDPVPTLLCKARALYDEPEPPEGRHGCKECEKLDRVRELLAGNEQ